MCFKNDRAFWFMCIAVIIKQMFQSIYLLSKVLLFFHFFELRLLAHHLLSLKRSSNLKFNVLYRLCFKDYIV